MEMYIYKDTWLFTNPLNKECTKTLNCEISLKLLHHSNADFGTLIETNWKKENTHIILGKKTLIALANFH